MKNNTVILMIIALMNFIPILSFSQDNAVDQKEALIAFEYLNKVRASPKSFSKEIGVRLNYVKSKQALIWNNTLALDAEKKALDMLERNYFGHVDPDGNGINILIFEAGYKMPEDWYKDISKNNFESIGAGYSGGIELIQQLIEDKGVSPPGHRNHLLGIEDFWANCTDIGIGFAKGEGSKYPSYCCIIIAKHDF